PQVEIVSATVAPIAGTAADSATHELTVMVRNSGLLPTAMQQARRIKIVRPDRVVARAAQGSNARVIGRPTEFWQDGGESQTVKLRLRAGTSTADRRLIVRMESTRGGVAEREVTW